MANLSFSVFANSLAEELGSENYLCFTSLEEALVVVSLASRQPTLTVCLKEHATRKCSIWKCLLNDEAMLHHVSFPSSFIPSALTPSFRWRMTWVSTTRPAS